jgi:hypothetical protein
MTTTRELERRLAEHFLAEAPSRAPDWILPSALTTIDTTRQRRGLTAPRRNYDMPTYAKLAAAAVVVIAVGALALWQFAPPGPGGRPTPAPTPTASPTPVPTASPTPAASTYVPPALTERFISDFHGLSLSYPTGWTARAATQPWTTSGPFFFLDPTSDFLYDPGRTDHLFLGMASQPLDGTPFDQWSTDFLAAEGCEGTDPIVVDGVDGVMGADCGQAFVSSGGRGYVFWLYRSGDDPELQGVDWTAFLNDLLATVQLAPEDAVDEEPTASPRG